VDTGIFAYAEGKKYYEIDFVISDNKYLIYTKDYHRENGVDYIPVYMTMFL